MPDATNGVFEKLALCRFISRFVLVEGTAPSVQLRHRLQKDLDFVLNTEKLDINAIKRNIHAAFTDYRIIRQDAPWQIDFVINKVKLPFFSAGAIALSFSLGDKCIHYRLMRICSSKTLATLKIAAIAQRNKIAITMTSIFSASTISR